MPGPEQGPDDDAYVVDTRRRRSGGARSDPRSSGQRPAAPRPPSRPPARSSSTYGPRQGGLSAVHRRRRIVAGAVVLLVAWLAFMVWVPFNAWGNVHRVNADPSAARPAESKGYDYVLVGSDSRQGLTAEQQKQLNTGSTKDAGGLRTDSIILVHVPSGGGKPALISLPRDSYVPIPGHGRNKINAAYSLGGP